MSPEPPPNVGASLLKRGRCGGSCLDGSVESTTGCLDASRATGDRFLELSDGDHACGLVDDLLRRTLSESREEPVQLEPLVRRRRPALERSSVRPIGEDEQEARIAGVTQC